MLSTKPKPEQALVSTSWLKENLANPNIRILDCTTFMTSRPVGASMTRSGRDHWASGHIPGSQYLDVILDLSNPAPNRPYALASEQSITRTLNAMGIGDTHHIILYGTAHPSMVTRAWWALKASGFSKVSILNGGWETWLTEKHSVSTEMSHYEPVQSTPSRNQALIADIQDVENAISDENTYLVNALSPEQFAGSSGSHYGRPGRIPNSLNLPANSLLTPDAYTFLPLDALAAQCEKAGLIDNNKRVITYCGGGIAASATLFALYRLGWPHLSLYDLSLLEWSNDLSKPMVVS